MNDKSKVTHGYDNDTHHLIQLKIPPPSLIQLREELQKPENAAISEFAAQGNTFEECIARLAIKLDIVLDGEYDGAELCDVLVTALRNRKLHGMNPHLRDKRLVGAEIVETDGNVVLTLTHGTEKEVEVEEVKEVKLIDTDGKEIQHTHTCHWPGCDKIVPPRMYACQYHWWALPAKIRAQIWATYRDGQEIDKKPSKRYLEAVKEAEIWIYKSKTYAREEAKRQDIRDNLNKLPKPTSSS